MVWRPPDTLVGRPNLPTSVLVLTALGKRDRDLLRELPSLEVIVANVQVLHDPGALEQDKVLGHPCLLQRHRVVQISSPPFCSTYSSCPVDLGAVLAACHYLLLAALVEPIVRI